MSRRHDSTSIRTTAIVIGFTIATILLFTIISRIMAPERLEAPPISTITYEKPPAADVPEFDFDAVPARSAYLPSRHTEIEDRPQYSDDTFAAITGTVVDALTREPIANAIVETNWALTDEESQIILQLGLAFNRKLLQMRQDAGAELDLPPEDMYTEANEILLDEYGIERKSDIGRFNSKTGRQQRTYSDGDGKFELHVPYDRAYSMRATHSAYKTTGLSKLFHESGTSPPPVIVEMDPGASIAGLVFNVADNEGVPFIGLNITAIDVTRVGNQRLHLHENGDLVTDKKGNYAIGGLLPGDYEIRVRHQFTRYRPGKVLPFKKITITAENEKLTGVDFGLARAGVVWGYVRNPEEDTPLTANLLLVGPENMITQGINAALSGINDGGESMETRSTFTDQKKNGYYEFVGVPLDREWKVHAETTDAAPQLSDPFILTESSPDIRVDINLYSGTKVTGRVIDQDGVGIADAEIACIPRFSEFFTPLNSVKTFRNTRTNEWGEFEIDDLPNGSYQIFALAEGYKIAVRGTPIMPDGYNDITGVHIRLNEIEHGDYDIYGQVTDSAGRPVPDAHIDVAGFSIEMMLDRGGDMQQNTKTDAEGRYRFTGMSIGKYFMNVKHADFPEKRVTKVLLDKPTDITLDSGVIISGTVFDGDTNRPYRESFRISVEPSIDTFQQPDLSNPMETFGTLLEQFSGRSESFVSESGEFVMTIPPGKFTIRAEAGDSYSDPTDIEADDGDVISDLEFFIGGAGGVIDGWVTTRDGGNPQGAEVRLIQMGMEVLPGVSATMGINREETIGEDGRFVFEQVPGGVYRVTATHPAYAAAQTPDLEIGRGKDEHTVTLVIGNGGSIEGYVTNRGSAVPNATVILLGSVDSNAVSTDDNGFFYMDNVGAGDHAIVAVAAASINIANMGSNLGTPVSVQSGQTTRINLERTSGVE